VEWSARRKGQDVAARTDRGVLLGSGLIAGEGLVGVGLAAYIRYTDGEQPAGIGIPEGLTEGLAVVAFALVGLFLYLVTRLPRNADTTP
jgi:hypothetical protein